MGKLSAPKLVVFGSKNIRRIWHKEEWWFAIVDIVEVLTDSTQPSGYIKDMRRRDEELNKGWGQIATPLSLTAMGGSGGYGKLSSSANGNPF